MSMRSGREEYSDRGSREGLGTAWHFLSAAAGTQEMDSVDYQQIHQQLVDGGLIARTAPGAIERLFFLACSLHSRLWADDGTTSHH